MLVLIAPSGAGIWDKRFSWPRQEQNIGLYENQAQVSRSGCASVKLHSCLVTVAMVYGEGIECQQVMALNVIKPSACFESVCVSILYANTVPVFGIKEVECSVGVTDCSCRNYLLWIVEHVLWVEWRVGVRTQSCTGTQDGAQLYLDSIHWVRRLRWNWSNVCVFSVHAHHVGTRQRRLRQVTVENM